MSKVSVRIKGGILLFGFVLVLAVPLSLLAARVDGDDPHHCREMKDYLEYSEDRLKTMHQLEIKFKHDQADYNNFCSTK